MAKTPDVFMVTLYKGYLEKRRKGLQATSCLGLSVLAMLRPTLFPTWTIDELEAACLEMHNAGRLQCRFVNEQMDGGNILPATIEALEQRFPGGLAEVQAFLTAQA